MTKYSIVIRCYNEGQHIEKLLSGILNQSVSDLEIIIVDSGSTDDTLEIASRYPTKIVSIKPTEFTFGRSLNLGCKEATGEYIVIVSAHVYPLYRDWLSNLLEPFKDPKVAIAYGKQQGNEITKYSEQRVFAKWFPDSSNYDQVHPFCNNANAIIRRSLWEKIFYNENLTGLEDVDWAKQVQNLGYKVAYVAEAPIVHIHDETFSRVYNRYRREAIALKQIFPEQKFSLIDFLRLFISNVISDYFHACHDGVIQKKATEIVLFRFMQFWGTYHGYRDRVNNKLRETFYYPNKLKRPQPINRPKLELAIDYANLMREHQ